MRTPEKKRHVFIADPDRASHTLRVSWGGTAFIIEALLLTFFLIWSLAIFVQLFSHADANATKAARLQEATSLARDTAETFSSHPTTGTETAKPTKSGLVVTWTSEGTKKNKGTLYNATITVTDKKGDLVYELKTSRYVRGA